MKGTQGRVKITQGGHRQMMWASTMPQCLNFTRKVLINNYTYWLFRMSLKMLTCKTVHFYEVSSASQHSRNLPGQQSANCRIRRQYQQKTFTPRVFHSDSQRDSQHTWHDILCANRRQQDRKSSETTKWC